MNSRQILGIIAGIFVLLLIVIVTIYIIRPDAVFGQRTTAKIHDTTYSLLVAKSEADKQKGLSGRSSLPTNEGMLFPFDKKDYYSFWMKDMKFPLDLIFLDDDRVVTIHKDVQPPASSSDQLQVYTSTEPANRVLELNAGQADEVNLQKGDTIDLNYDNSGN